MLPVAFISQKTYSTSSPAAIPSSGLFPTVAAILGPIKLSQVV